MTFLARTPVILTSLALVILSGAGFAVFNDALGGSLLDQMSDPEAARAQVAAMTASQRSAHAWVTALIDTVFPLANGAVLAGLALRFFGRYGKFAALPALLFVITDLTENLTQLLALTGLADALDAKAWVTPLKYNLFLVASVIALVGLVIGVVAFVRRRRA